MTIYLKNKYSSHCRFHNTSGLLGCYIVSSGGYNVRFDVSTAALLRTRNIQDVMLCCWVGVSRCSKGMKSLHRQWLRNPRTPNQQHSVPFQKTLTLCDCKFLSNIMTTMHPLKTEGTKTTNEKTCCESCSTVAR